MNLAKARTSIFLSLEFVKVVILTTFLTYDENRTVKFNTLNVFFGLIMFFRKCFILVDLESIMGTLCTRWEYTLE